VSRRIRTTRQARRIRDLVTVGRFLAAVDWTGLGFTSREGSPAVTITGATITAAKIAAGSMLPLYRLASCPLGDPVIDWEADT
jgi:hypothetical protein